MVPGAFLTTLISSASSDEHYPPFGGFFRRVIFNNTHMIDIITTLSKKIDDESVSTWRFVKTPEGFCALGGNYKLISFRNEFAMKKSIKWFASKGYKAAA